MGTRKKAATKVGVILVKVATIVLLAGAVVTVYLAAIGRADQEPAIAWAFVGFAIVLLAAALFCLGVIDRLRAGNAKMGIDVRRSRDDSINKKLKSDKVKDVESHRTREAGTRSDGSATDAGGEPEPDDD